MKTVKLLMATALIVSLSGCAFIDVPLVPLI